MVPAPSSSTEAVAEDFQQQRRRCGRVANWCFPVLGAVHKKKSSAVARRTSLTPPDQSRLKRWRQKAGIQYIELPVAYDALNGRCQPRKPTGDSMTIADLKKENLGSLKRRARCNWSQVRQGWPNAPRL